MQSKYINVEKFQQKKYPVTFIIGARGVGKTISALSNKLKENYQNKTTFIYLRRYQSEIETASFNLKLISELVGQPVTRTMSEDPNGRKVDCLLVKGRLVCYLMALSTAAKYKTNDYSMTTEIVYDEFIDPRGRELKNETKLFLNYAMTVFRDFSKYKALFLANATDLYNCYFLDFMIMPSQRVTKFSKLGIKIVMYQTSSELENEHLNSVLGQQVTQIEGENGSSLHNEFDNAFDDFLAKLTKNAKYSATLWLSGNAYGLYTDNNCLVLSNKADYQFKSNYAMTLNDTADNRPVLSPMATGNLVNNFKQGTLRFTDVKARSKWIKFFKHPYANSEV